MPITQNQKETLAFIFDITEAPEKISMEFDDVSKSVIIKYENMDVNWFNDLNNDS